MNKLTKWGIAILGVPLALGVIGNMLPQGDDVQMEVRPTWTATPMATATSAPAVAAPTETTVVIVADTPAPTDVPTAVTVAETPTAAPDTSARTNAAANLRAGPGTDYAVVGSTQEGEAVDIVARTDAGDWYQLANGAWVAAALVSNPPDVGVAAVIPPLPVQPVVEATPTSPAVFIQPTAVQPQAVCSCSSDSYSCASFSGHASAQACFSYCLSVGAGDIHRLDGDNDGSVCED